MKMRMLIFTATMALLAGPVFAEIVIKPVRSGSSNTNRPGIVVPGPADSGFRGTRQKPQVLQLLNGDHLQGTFVDFHLDTGATWRHPASKNDFKFAADSISNVHLNPRGALNLPKGQNCTVKFRTGDEVLGQLVEINKTHVILSAWYSSNSIRIPRAKILSIHPGSGSGGAIFTGPTGLDGWTQAAVNERPKNMPFNGRVIRGGLVPAGGRGGFGRVGVGGGWQYSNNSFISHASGSQIGRQFKDLPDSVNVEFDLSWATTPSLVLYLYSDQLQQHKGNAYIVQINNSASCMMMQGSSGNQISLGTQSMTTQLRGKTKAHFAISANRKTRIIMLTMNGKLIKKWTGTSALLGKGKGIMFISQTTGMMRISKMRVTRWNGQVPKGNGFSNSGDGTKDVIGTATGNLTGVLHGFRGGKVKFDATASIGSIVDMPLEKIGVISFAGAKPEKRKLEIGDVRATFSGGGEFVFRLDHWTADRVTGMSPAIGRVDFDPAVFSSLEFNLNKLRGEGN
jgi:hypothetical protein